MNALPSLTDLRDRVGALDAGAEAVAAPQLIDGPWFAAETNPGCEVKALHGFTAMGWTAFTPFGWKYQRPRRARSKAFIMRRKVGMPGYVFIVSPRDARGDLRVSEAKGVLGVRRLIASAGAPLRVRADSIHRLRLAEAAGAYDVGVAPPRGKLWDLDDGDEILIVSGQFEGWLCTVVGRSTGTRVTVVDKVFGRRLSVPLDQITPLDISREQDADG